MPTTAPYGSWKSPITSDLIVTRAKSPNNATLDGDTLYWLEMRPEEKGRMVIVRQLADGSIEDVLPAPFNARSRVHEYGGGSYLAKNDVVYFSNFADQRLYRLVSGQEPQPLTPAVDLRYADYVLDSMRGRLIGIREDHTTGAPQAVNTICQLSIDGSDLEQGGRVLVSGNDFYSTPRLSPDGKHLCWLTWNHPYMPWDGTELWLADFSADGSLINAHCIAGGVTESIFQPEWSPESVLYFISDRTGWWNLYRWQDGQAQALHPMPAEFGEPQWVFGMRTYGFQSASRLVCAFGSGVTLSLALLDTRTLNFEVLDLPYQEFVNLCAGPGYVVFIGGSPTQPRALVRLNLNTLHAEVLCRSTELVVDPGYISVAQMVEFPTANGLTAYAYYYPPTNCDFAAPQNELPPLIVKSHGGPTGSTSTTFSLGIQYWTSRGFAVVDVDYGGSTAYGRAYRERLKGQWGIVDVDDCVNAALYLARSGKADLNRMAITGGSAGGYTTLCALTFRNQVFRAGASYYGISDAEALATDTHKFELRYLDGLIGPYPAAREIYVERSPIHFAHQLNCALILFQGSEDRVVPPEQSRRMYQAALARELPAAYIEFEGEQHGFRQSHNIKRALDAELYFYSKIFGFNLADPVDPVQIENF